MVYSKPCKTCGKLICKRKREGNKRWEARKYCSHKCSSILTEEEKTVRTERILSYIGQESKEELLERMKKMLASRNANGIWVPPMTGRKGKDCPSWLGDQAQYSGIHRWIQQNWQKTGICEECGSIPTTKGRNKWATQWSNNDHLYKRDREEWQELCPKCHKKKDKEIRTLNNKQ